MVKKTVEFVKVNLINRGTGEVLDTNILREIFETVMQESGLDNDGYSSIDLRPEVDTSELSQKEVLDIFEECDQHIIFGRLSKKKENNALLKRYYESLKAEEALSRGETGNAGIEVFTFFYLELPDRDIINC